MKEDFLVGLGEQGEAEVFDDGEEDAEVCELNTRSWLALLEASPADVLQARETKASWSSVRRSHRVASRLK
ncbi:hypothetical protein [Streptomyces sp. 7N604]|uniref:hypothetical protein n=1 Tax=Streptomyces sp. 7N604 TaxID=3457415 RepID=UPI003FCF6ACD